MTKILSIWNTHVHIKLEMMCLSLTMSKYELLRSEIPQLRKPMADIQFYFVISYSILKFTENIKFYLYLKGIGCPPSASVNSSSYFHIPL